MSGTALGPNFLSPTATSSLVRPLSAPLVALSGDLSSERSAAGDAASSLDLTGDGGLGLEDGSDMNAIPRQSKNVLAGAAAH